MAKTWPQVLDVLVEKYPQAFFGGMVAMTKVIRWETGADAASFSRTLTPEEVTDKLEERVGPEGRKLFEKFIRQVYVLQAKQQLEAQAQMGDTERSRERGRFSSQPLRGRTAIKPNRDGYRQREADAGAPPVPKAVPRCAGGYRSSTQLH